MLRTLLIANRGEIACRIARTARGMGIETVAVFSDADADALHVAAADRAIRIGAPPARESYLNPARLIDAARRAGADSVHPGYGFLSENADFAQACLDAGLVWVGPPPAAMRAMGSKSAAKALMEHAGVPVLPGYHGLDQNPDHLAAEAGRLGFPVVIKAIAGGGGRGMRVVRDADGFLDSLAAARQEGAAAFGDDTVLIERYLERPRHIEIQVFADSHGNAVHLFERDCSAQRRHQKVIEEAPAPGLDPATRVLMGAAAVSAATAVGYVGAGTVEFVAEAGRFFFLEMNTRLQVEHPVTEMVTGLDLVEWQLRVAAGENLPATQSQIALTGHAIEARIYAEDPTRDFAPSVGRLAALRFPTAATGVRVDTGVRTGDLISIHYDPMIAKLICHSANRETALASLRRALAETSVAGLATNLDLLARIAAHPDFAAGGIDTGFIARHAATLLAPPPPPPARVLALAALGVLAAEAAASPDPHAPWGAADGWWLNVTPERVLEFRADEIPCPATAARDGAGWRITAGTETLRGHATLGADGLLAAELDGLRQRTHLHVQGATVTLRADGETWRLTLPAPGADAFTDDATTGGLMAPIPGQITAVDVAEGQRVTRGDTLVVLEAMKTVFRLVAPADAEIAEITCRPGDMVEGGQLLIRFAESVPVTEGEQ